MDRIIHRDANGRTKTDPAAEARKHEEASANKKAIAFSDGISTDQQREPHHATGLEAELLNRGRASGSTRKLIDENRPSDDERACAQTPINPDEQIIDDGISGAPGFMPDETGAPEVDIENLGDADEMDQL